jgi:hypothetical protein
MNDRELLELAAKAAVEPQWDGTNQCFALNGFYWNPLESDGDVLRLAVQLGLTISITKEARVRPHRTSVWTYGTPQVQEPHAADARAATRRAIVRAAAEIGKAMP